MASKRTPPTAEVEALAWQIHREHGHPEGYRGPCWGPLPDEIQEARERMVKAAADDTPNTEEAGR